MTITRKLTAATATALLAVSGVAAAADAPVVGSQKTSTARTAPATIPGTGIQKGERLPNGARIVYRDVTIEGSQIARFTIKAPAGKRLRGLAPREGSDVGFVVTSQRQLRRPHEGVAARLQEPEGRRRGHRPHLRPRPLAMSASAAPGPRGPARRAHPSTTACHPSSSAPAPTMPSSPAVSPPVTRRRSQRSTSVTESR